MSVVVHHGDSRDVLKTLADASVHSVVTDPPYALVSIGKRFGADNAAPAKAGKSGAYARASAGFMGQRWDNGSTAFDPEFWAEVLRVLKPGGHVLAFGGTRTYHRLAVAIEDAGFEIRDAIQWLYGSGFPKSHDVSKGIDKSRAGSAFGQIRDHLRRVIAASKLSHGKIKEHLGYPADSGVVSHWVGISQPGVPCWRDWLLMKQILPLGDSFDDLICTADREIVGVKYAGISDRGATPRHTIGAAQSVAVDVTAPATDAARQWEGWGTALKPACEIICVARKPLGAASINVRGIIEAQLRERGIEGDIRWSKSSVRRAENNGRSSASYSTKSAGPSATFAESVAQLGETAIEPPIQNPSAPLTKSGELPTGSTSDCPAANVRGALERKSSPPTAKPALAAASKSQDSSPSTTSTAAARRTGKASTAKYTSNSGGKDSLPAIECFAGIATGLTGSTERVPINKLKDGSFAWPEGVPEFIPSSPLTVAGNVLQHGTGALNIDACRVGEEQTVTIRSGHSGDHGIYGSDSRKFERANPPGRWPANCVHDGSDEVVSGFPIAPGQQRGVGPANGAKPSVNVYGDYGPREQFNPRGDEGSAARFFYQVQKDVICPLCSADIADSLSATRNTPTGSSVRFGVAASPSLGDAANGSLASADAANAGDSSEPCLPLTSDSAQPNAATWPLERIARNVRSAAGLCGSCATAIAQSLAGARATGRLAPLPSTFCIDDSRRTILSHSLASYVASRESTDIILTMPSLSELFGSVFHAIGASISSAASEPNGRSEPRRLFYNSKADAADRLGSKHPTVKPVDLMRWLVRLVTPPGGRVLDPFAGSGTTGMACLAEGFDAVLIEREEQYYRDIRRRIAHVSGQDAPLFAQPESA